MKNHFPVVKSVFEATFPTNLGYVYIEKWFQICVLGTGIARTESGKKGHFHLQKWPLPHSIVRQTNSMMIELGSWTNLHYPLYLHLFECEN